MQNKIISYKMLPTGPPPRTGMFHYPPKEINVEILKNLDPDDIMHFLETNPQLLNKYKPVFADIIDREAKRHKEIGDWIQEVSERKFESKADCYQNYTQGKRYGFTSPVALDDDLSKAMGLAHMPRDEEGKTIYTRALLSSWWTIYLLANKLYQPGTLGWLPDEFMVNLFGIDPNQTLPAVAIVSLVSPYVTRSNIQVTPEIIAALCEEGEDLGEHLDALKVERQGQILKGRLQRQHPQDWKEKYPARQRKETQKYIRRKYKLPSEVEADENQ